MTDPWSNRYEPSFVSNRTPDIDTESDRNRTGLVSLLVKRVSELEAENTELGRLLAALLATERTDR